MKRIVRYRYLQSNAIDGLCCASECINKGQHDVDINIGRDISVMVTLCHAHTIDVGFKDEVRRVTWPAHWFDRESVVP